LGTQILHGVLTHKKKIGENKISYHTFFFFLLLKPLKRLEKSRTIIIPNFDNFN
jgi:hypothetical protein